MDHRQLLLRLVVVRDELELLRHDRQVGVAPLLQLLVIRVRLGEPDKVTDRPRDHVVLTRDVGLVLARRERVRERAGQVAADGRLLCDYERLTHGVPFQDRRTGRMLDFQRVHFIHASVLRPKRSNFGWIAPLTHETPSQGGDALNSHFKTFAVVTAMALLIPAGAIAKRPDGRPMKGHKPRKARQGQPRQGPGQEAVQARHDQREGHGRLERRHDDGRHRGQGQRPREGLQG